MRAESSWTRAGTDCLTREEDVLRVGAERVGEKRQRTDREAAEEQEQRHAEPSPAATCDLGSEDARRRR